MDNDGIDTDQLHQYDIPGKAILKRYIDHGITTVFDHDGFAGKALYIGQCLGKHPRDLNSFGSL
jgi:hypothetical protein